MKTTAFPLLLVALCLGTGSLSSAPAAVFFVSTNGSDTLTGTSWADAKLTVSAAIEAAEGGDEIWVARGSYAGHLTLKPDLALYGGFAGTETSRDQRNWTNHLSVLWGVSNRAVVTVTGGGPATRLDGFTIGGGIGIHGGGVRVIGAAPVTTRTSIGAKPKLSLAKRIGSSLSISDRVVTLAAPITGHSGTSATTANTSCSRSALRSPPSWACRSHSNSTSCAQLGAVPAVQRSANRAMV